MGGDRGTEIVRECRQSATAGNVIADESDAVERWTAHENLLTCGNGMHARKTIAVRCGLEYSRLVDKRACGISRMRCWKRSFRESRSF
jgi:hypothetical protein